ncbi:MAG: single-stranded-DNA-specific exonuclease RecJ [Eubacteriales bacterium]|nr:single-stranded-DNA-specific exonuclease RecJ [Eubacteriales bacterium]
MLYTLKMRNTLEAQEEAVQQMARLAGVRPLTARLLLARGIDTPERYRAYAAPDLAHCHDPFLLPDMEAAVQRIRSALEQGERITLYGDYDVDGVSAVTLLCEYFRSVGAQPRWYIPSRHHEGYGLNTEAVKQLAADTDLLITVDCGVTNLAEAALAKSLGMDLIITDHHECPETLPQCAAVVDPKRADSQYPFAGLCGTGVAGKLAQALGGTEALLAGMDLIALATVADIVPLQEENRLFVQLGLARMNESPRPGLRALMESAGIQGEVRAYHLGFQLGPRINAGGRMELAHRSAELLQCTDEETAGRLARQLEQDNQERQQTCAAILDEALAMLEGQYDFEHQRCIVLVQPHWNAGVIGIVAARIAERYHRPTVLFGQGEEGCYGSARSIPGVHIYEAMKSCAGLLTRFGGHEQAAGCAISAENIPTFRDELDEYLRRTYPDGVFLPLYRYDMECQPEELDLGLAREIHQMEPCGYGNPRPVLLLRGICPEGVRTLSQGKHLKFMLKEPALEGIAFSQGEQADAVKSGEPCDLLFSPEENTFGGHTRLQLKAERIFPGQGGLPAVSAQAWQRSLAAQFCAGDSQLPPAGEGLDADAWAQALCAALRASPWGTAVLCHTPQQWDAVRRILQENDCGERCYAETLRPVKALLGENTVLAAPIPDGLPMGRYSRLFLPAQPLNPAYEAALKTRLLKNGQCYIIKYPTLPGAFGEELAAFGRQELLEVYRRVKQGVASGACRGPEDRDFLGLPAWQGDLGLRIFAELELIAPVQCPPWWRIEVGKKVDLWQSATFRSLEQWKGGTSHESEG